MNGLITVDEAQSLITEHTPEFDRTERVILREAYGRVLAEDVVADRPFPPYRRAMMDGIACRRSEEREFKVAGIHVAGVPMPRKLEEGECWEIMTGAVVPDECDLLVPYEEVQIEKGVAQIVGEMPSEGAYIHLPGSDAKAGAVILKKGKVLDAVALGVAASAGYMELVVIEHPRVAIVSTGDELVEVQFIPKPWQIRRSNPVVLGALLRGMGVEPVSQHAAGDDEEYLEKLIKHLACVVDVILISGGISKGKRDFVRPVLEGLYGDPVFHGVSQRPGKPLAFWKSQDGPMIFALPGNPRSALTATGYYVLPVLKQMMDLPASPCVVRLGKDVEQHPKLTVFLPVSVKCDAEAQLIATPCLAKNSGDEIGAGAAMGFVKVPAGDKVVAAGEVLEYVGLSDF